MADRNTQTKLIKKTNKVSASCLIGHASTHCMYCMSVHQPYSTCSDRRQPSASLFAQNELRKQTLVPQRICCIQVPKQPVRVRKLPGRGRPGTVRYRLTCILILTIVCCICSMLSDGKPGHLPLQLYFLGLLTPRKTRLICWLR